MLFFTEQAIKIAIINNNKNLNIFFTFFNQVLTTFSVGKLQFSIPIFSLRRIYK